MRDRWFAPDELEEQPADSLAVYGDPDGVDASIQEDRPIERRPALAILDDDFDEIPTRMTP